MSASGGAASAARPEGASKSDLVSWLRSQLDTDERIARAATPGPWRYGDVTEFAAADVYAGKERITVAYSEPCCSIEDAEHIALNDPAHVLRTVAAHRAILDRHSPRPPTDAVPGERRLVRTGGAVCRRCALSWPCADALDLLSIYDSRPGFDPSWRAD